MQHMYVFFRGSQVVPLFSNILLFAPISLNGIRTIGNENSTHSKNVNDIGSTNGINVTIQCTIGTENLERYITVPE